jgi:magnesium chelatase family protein
MYAHVSTVAFEGIEAKSVDVQVQITAGLPAFTLVGLPDKAVAESRERVRGALAAIGLALPPKRITINLAPADLPKEGSHYDLPIALGLMAACGAVAPDALAGYCVIGELSLDGSITSVAGALPAAMGANGQDKGLICPKDCGVKAAWVSKDMNLLAPSNLLTLINHFKGLQTLPRPEPALEEEPDALPDMSEIKGQESAKRALEIAAAGGHNFLMIGPPGAGKSMQPRRLPSILPPLTAHELLEVFMVHSMAGALSGGQVGRARPFRAPHHSASMAALVGGGTKPKPGEAALAHLGVLFLDELQEFTPQVLDALRQPLESGETVIARANHRIVYPSRVQLIAAMNPCRCGRAGEPGFACQQGRNCADRYQARVSGPLLDRIDMQIEVPTVTAADLIMPASAEGSDAVRARVIAARNIQSERYSGLEAKGVRTNSDCAGPLLEEIAAPDRAGMVFLREAADTLKLSARGYHRTLRVARTMADLDGAEHVTRVHIAEALSYRGETLKRQIAA